MHGNVWEWCQDDWHENYIDAPKDGGAWTSQSGNIKVLRGGSWVYDPQDCRSASRDVNYGDVRGYIYVNIGFRVVCGAAWT
jgi:formylglycine-generating enzyme required for sulfatase activity